MNEKEFRRKILKVLNEAGYNPEGITSLNISIDVNSPSKIIIHYLKF